MREEREVDSTIKQEALGHQELHVIWARGPQYYFFFTTFWTL